MHIIIPDDYQDAVRHLDCFAVLAGHTVTIYNDTVKDVDTLAARFAEADALVLIRERTRITEALLARLPRLKLISQTGKGTAHIDLEACTRHAVMVSAGAGSPYAPAELTWALVLAATRFIPQEVAAMRAGRWQTTLGRGLHGRTLGIYGYGKIGSLVAGYGRAFGMRVLVWGREGSLTRAAHDGYETVSDGPALFAQSDVLSVHIKLTAETRGIITADDLAALSPTALFVNTSRAELIARGALVAALRVGRPGYAAVDVYEEEPVTDQSVTDQSVTDQSVTDQSVTDQSVTDQSVTDHPLLHMDNVVCTPHLGYVERDSYERYFGTAFEQVVAFAAGTPINVVTG